MSPGAESGAKRKRGGRKTSESIPGGRLLAEWITLGVSLLLIFLTAGYLVYDSTRPRDSILPIAVRPLLEDSRQEGGRHILPVEIENGGRRTIRDLNVEVTFLSDAGERKTQEIRIEYLGEHSKQEVYVFIDRDPAEARVEGRVRNYRLD